MDSELALGWNSPLVTGLRMIKPDKTNADKPKNKQKPQQTHNNQNYCKARMWAVADLCNLYHQ